MAKKFARKKVILCKTEGTYGVSAAPTAALNAMKVVDCSLTPIDGEEIELDYYLPWLGHQGILPTGLFGRVEFSVDVAGSGTAGTAPGWGPLMRACGMAETVTAGTDVVYNRVSEGHESGTFVVNFDGVQHILLGARGTWTVEPTPKQIPRFRYTFTGLLGTITDAALPTPVLTIWQRPVAVSKANTTMSLHGISTVPTESFRVDLGNDVQTRMLINEDSIQIVDSKVVGHVVIEQIPLATKDWFQAYQGQALGVFGAVHGTVAGNIVAFDAPSVQLGKPTYGETQGINNMTIPLMMIPSAGNDELTVTVR